MKPGTRVKSPCPVCGGSGQFELPHGMSVDTVEIKNAIARRLREKGYSIRQIQRALGYKSPQSIHRLFK